MKRYVLKKCLTGILIVLISLCINFVLIHTAPGDPITILAGQDNPSPEMIERLTEKYGLNDPVPVQFLNYIKTLLKGDLGFSILSNESVLNLIAGRVGATLLLSLSGVILSLIIGTTLGILTARREDSKLDIALNGLSYVFNSTPGFWLGLMMILLFASTLKIFPTSGMVNLRAAYTGFEKVLDILYHLALPLLTIVLLQTPTYMRIARSSVIQAMSDDYVLTFRAAGMPENQIFKKYIFKNAILPTITTFGINLAYAISGVTVLEIVFAWPGMGRLLMDSIMKRDYPLLMGIYLIVAVSIAVCMILVDIIYAIVDPRIRYE